MISNERNKFFLWLCLSCFFSPKLSAMTPRGYAGAYEWEIGGWSHCSSNMGCGDGHRDRRISCVHLENGLVVPDSNCASKLQPAPTESCFQVCEKLKPYLRWSTGPWSTCIPKPAICSAAGTATRLVQCLYETDEGLEKLVPRSACEHFWTKPEDIMSCSYECPQGCVVSEGVCADNSTSCQMTVRLEIAIIVAPEPNGSECPDVKQNSCPDRNCLTVENDNEGYVLKVSDWGPCLPIVQRNPDADVFNGLSLKPEVGVTTRNFSCISGDGRTVEMSYCTNNLKGMLQQRCLVPKDCELSPWSEWKVVKEGCINSMNQVFSETRIRTRNLVKPPLGNGKPCGLLYEERTIRVDLPICNKYKWFPMEWGECVVYEHREMAKVDILKPTCGGGVQTRNITCLRVYDLVPVAEQQCAEVKPPMVQRCELDCVRDCEVSHWSKWGPCLPTDTVTDYTKQLLTGYRKRSRSIVISPSSKGGSCPHLEEMDTCTHVLVVNGIYGNWSTCHLLDPEVQCGFGDRRRDYSCVTFEGNPLKEVFCDKRASNDKASEICRIPCPNDCTLSEWSEWSPCPRTCHDGSEEVKSHRNRTVLAIEGPGGTLCDENKEDVQTCHQQSCSLVTWWTSPWGECVPFNGSNCGDGVQTRSIVCHKGKNLHLNEHECRNLRMPEETRTCWRPCPVDCTMTEFSEWSICPENCQSGATQRRYRFLEKYEQHAGKPCDGPLEEVRSCTSANDVTCLLKYGFKNEWSTGPWSLCVLPDINRICGTGFQSRDISCNDETGYPVEMHHCLKFQMNETTDVASIVKVVPPAFRLCQIPCHEDSSSCVHSAWTPWSTCPHRYKAKRVRTRELVGGSAEDAFCKEQFSLYEEEDCPFGADHQITTSQTHWFSCILEESNHTVAGINDHIARHYCGTGYRYKHGLEVKGVDEMEPGLEMDLCLIDCPVDCVMSEWSYWSHCNVPCGSGYRERKRHVVIPANSLGRPCPLAIDNGTEIQIDVCGESCSEFYWWAGGWTNCDLLDPRHEICGNGTRQRTVKCLDKRTDETVDDSRCDPLLKPQDMSLCSVACPGDCVLSDWKTFKHCNQPCHSAKYLERRRVVLRKPDFRGKPCADLISKEECRLNVNCYKHSWKFGEWGGCVLPKGSACGEGIQRRALQCIRSDGRQVDAMNCKKIEELPSLNHSLSKPCYQDCPIDCIMSHWSSWMDLQCRLQCGNDGIATRYRYVLQPSSEVGQPCPSEVEQKKPCPFRPCFHWVTMDWSPCELEGASCGHGVRRRLVRCVRYDGIQVDKIQCAASNLTFEPKGWLDPKWLTLAHGKTEEEECYVRCPGDCILSEWTEWGHCHRDCNTGQSVGYQTSSRTMLMPGSSMSTECLSTMWRTRPCWDNECITFQWKFKNIGLVCERSDGLIVKGGCTKAPRPCFSECESQLGGKCDSRHGICYCKMNSGKWVLITSLKSARRKCQNLPLGVAVMGPKRPANHTASSLEIRLKYYPDDNEVSFWMYAMISIGSAFVIFVVVTVYLMCRSSIRQRVVSVQRQGSFRRRGPASPDHNFEPNSYS